LVKLKEGEMLFAKGDESDCMYLLLDGLIGVFESEGDNLKPKATRNLFTN